MQKRTGSGAARRTRANPIVDLQERGARHRCALRLPRGGIRNKHHQGALFPYEGLLTSQQASEVGSAPKGSLVQVSVSPSPE